MVVYNVKTESIQPFRQRGDRVPQSKVIFLALGASEMSYKIIKQVSFRAYKKKVTDSIPGLTL
jgi:hypothetical protein